MALKLEALERSFVSGRPAFEVWSPKRYSQEDVQLDGEMVEIDGSRFVVSEVQRRFPWGPILQGERIRLVVKPFPAVAAKEGE